jgi:DNA polymerase-1
MTRARRAVPPAERPRAFLLDLYALAYRVHFALLNRPLQTSRGENTSVPWGIARFLLKLMREHEPAYWAAVFDAGHSHRHLRYSAYKATRQRMPEDLERALERVRQLLQALRVPIVELPGYEADDVIGTLAIRAAQRGVEAVIVSGDKDFVQLVRPGVCLLNPGRGGPTAIEEEWVDVTNAAARLGVPPERVVDYLALVGDSADNIPGVPGVGPKTALDLLQRFGSLDEALARAADVPQARVRQALQAHAEAARLSRELVTIRTDLDLPLDLDDLRRQEPDWEALRRLFVELEFHSLLRELPEAAGAPAAPTASVETERRYQAVTDPAAVADLVVRARARGRVAVDTETSSLTPLDAVLVGLSLAFGPGEAYYLPFAHRDGPNLPPLLHPDLQPLVAMLEDPAVAKVGQNLKYDLLVLRRAGVALRGLAVDTMVAGYLLEPGRRDHNLEALALRHLQRTVPRYEDVAGKGKQQIPFADVAVERAAAYACSDADVAWCLAEVLLPQLEERGLGPLFRTLEMPLVPVLADMEWTGIRIDPAVFAELAERFQDQLRALEARIYAVAGTTFNINSPIQLRHVLYERLGLPVLKRTKTGPSTDAAVLEELARSGHELPRLLLQYRELAKLLSTYVVPLPQMVHPVTGRLHTSFNQTVTATGRLSSSEPNLQNIPVRTQLGAEIRRGFVPEPGWVFVAADYSQIELRILAHYSEDPAFLDAFARGADIHRETAALVFCVPPEAVTREMRDRAKTVNFAVIYGISAHGLAQQLGISRTEAAEFIERYFARFPGVRRYLDAQIERARALGYVETLTGRRRYVPEIQSSDHNVRAFGERAAINAPIQGTAADLIKRAMIDIHSAIAAGELPARMLLQVHDELLFEVPASDAEAVAAAVRQRMENAASLKVPLVVEVGIGPNWLACK